MRNHFECALFCPPALESMFQSIAGTHAKGRFTVHHISDRIGVGIEPGPDALARLALVLQRYDACLVPVDVMHLSWFRSALLAARDRISTPIICISIDLAAGALNDLFEIDLSEFVRAPLCIEELRTRVSQILEMRSRSHRTSLTLNTTTLALEEPLEPRCSVASFTPARQSPILHRTRSVSRRGIHVCEELADQCGPYIDAFAAMVVASESEKLRSYKNSKQQFWGRYTCSYIHEQLRVCRGNVTKAATRAGKNRRAFSALMRLYGIDPAPYRSETHDDDTEG